MWRRLLDSEIPAFRLPAAILAGFSVYLLYNTFFNSITDGWEVPIARSFVWQGQVPDGYAVSQIAFRWLFWPSVIGAAVFRFWIIFSGPIRYERVMGKPFSNELMGSIVAANGIGLLAMLLVFGGGTDVSDVTGWIDTTIPTLVVIPAPFALLAANILGGLAYYGWHRAQHAWRPLWLLTHRIHHVPPQLSIVSTLPTEDPMGGLLSVVPKTLIMGGAAKLFSAAPMIPEAFLWSVLSWTAFEVVNHDEASYRWTMAGPLRRFWFGLLGGGAWHVMHHSARPGHEAVNLGGFPFQIWDRLFGTYVAPEPEPPPVGLTGRPRLWRNPIRIAFGGWGQLFGELRRNDGAMTRLKILFGSTAYAPPIPVHVISSATQPEQA